MTLLKDKKIRGKILENAPLKEYVSWRVGGNAEFLYIPADLEDLSLFLKQMPINLPLHWLGLGSNTLVRDGGIEGIVIITQGALQALQPISETIIRAESGISSAKLARFSARRGLKGIEFMAGIPGTVGGALAMNAGCFGGETWQYVSTVEMINRQGEIKKRPIADFEIKYRFVNRPIDEWFVAGHFELTKGDKDTALQTIHHLLARRNDTQPTGTANCGSVFRNPEGNFAGKLIESCGLKGKKIGGAQVSSKHANFIINHHHAKAVDIENLITEVKDIVLKQTGVELITEVCIIGKKI